MADTIITKADLAREMNLSRARITQLCQKGLPVRPDGKLDRAAAMRWIRMYQCPFLGGWYGKSRHPIADDGQRETPGSAQLEAVEALSHSMDGIRDIELPEFDFPEMHILDNYELDRERTEAVQGFIRGLRNAASMEDVFGLLRSFGCEVDEPQWRQWMTRVLGTGPVEVEP